MYPPWVHEYLTHPRWQDFREAMAGMAAAGGLTHTDHGARSVDGCAALPVPLAAAIAARRFGEAARGRDGELLRMRLCWAGVRWWNRHGQVPWRAGARRFWLPATVDEDDAWWMAEDHLGGPRGGRRFWMPVRDEIATDDEWRALCRE